MVTNNKQTKMQQQNDFSHLRPAINAGNTSQISPQEFQRQLYTWFEEKGVVSSLISYLRVLMIRELKHSNCGKIEQKNPFSLNKQAFSLLVAEYLLKEKCYYTLSVFSTEVPAVATQLPFSLLSLENKEFKFDRESLVSLLELLGISKETNEGLKITALYLSNGDSLLNCLIKGKTMCVTDLGQVNHEGDYLGGILKELGLTPGLIEEIKRKTQFEREEFERMVCERNHQIKILLETQLSQKNENKKLQKDLKQAQKKVKQFVLKEKLLKERIDEITNLQNNLEKGVQPGHCQLKHCDNSCLNLSKENVIWKDEVEKMNEVVRQKDKEIGELNLQVADLTRDLRNSRLSVDFLNGCLARCSQINQHNSEDNSQTDSSEHLTNEILLKVRRKLSELELESQEIDSRIKTLIIK